MATLACHQENVSGSPLGFGDFDKMILENWGNQGNGFVGTLVVWRVFWNKRVNRVARFAIDPQDWACTVKSVRSGSQAPVWDVLWKACRDIIK